MLSDEQIMSAWINNGGGLAANRYEDFARAVESAATAPLMERIAELERKSNQDDETIQWQAAEIAKHLDRIAELEMTQCMWRKIDDPRELCDGPVLLTWKDATGPARHRIGLYHRERRYEGKDYGDGFVCWWSGKPLTDTMTHWATPPLTP